MWNSLAKLKPTGAQVGAVGAVVYGVCVVYAAFTWSAWAAQVLGIIGSGASVLGIVYTLQQVRETKRLARDAKRSSNAAKEATDAAVEQLSSSHYRYSLLNVKGLLGQARAFVQSKKWSMASLRANDVADRASELAYARAFRDEAWFEATERFRDWARIFGAQVPNHSLDRATDDWDQLCNVLHNKIDKECAPFRLTENK